MARPEIRDVRDVVADALHTTAGVLIDGVYTYVPSRSQTANSLRAFQRIRAAWLVFTGRADAITYPGQP